MSSFVESRLVGDGARGLVKDGCLHGVFGIVDGGDGKDVSSLIILL